MMGVIVLMFLYENAKGPSLIIFELFSCQVANSVHHRIKFDGGQIVSAPRQMDLINFRSDLHTFEKELCKDFPICNVDFMQDYKFVGSKTDALHDLIRSESTVSRSYP